MTWVHMVRIHMTWIHMTLWSHIYNDVGAFSSDWNHHIKLLATILCWVSKNSFTINPLKCEWAVRETYWLGLWLTTWSIMPWKKMIDAKLQWIDVHVHWLCKLSSYMSQNCKHILKLLTDQSGLTIYIMDRQNTKAFVKCVCLWRQEHNLSRPR